MADRMVPPIEVVNVEFGDRQVAISFFDPQRDSPSVRELRVLHLDVEAEAFQARIIELLEDVYELVDVAEVEMRGAPPMTRPPRGLRTDGS